MSISILELSTLCKQLIDEVGKVIVGKKNMLKYVVLGILTDGHILFEDYPGWFFSWMEMCLRKVCFLILLFRIFID